MKPGEKETNLEKRISTKQETSNNVSQIELGSTEPVSSVTEKNAPKLLHNLPTATYSRFIGRQEYIDEIIKRLQPYPQSRYYTIAIDGIGGVGKTSLALEVCYYYVENFGRLKDERFEAIIWISAKKNELTSEGIKPRRQTVSQLDDIYTIIAVVLNREDIRKALPEQKDVLIRQALSTNRTLLVVDNLETIDDEKVIEFLRELPVNTKAIVTTRHKIDVAYPVHVLGMSFGEAEELIRQICDEKVVELTSQEIQELYNRTGGVPLAIVWSISQIGLGSSASRVISKLGGSSDVVRFCFAESIVIIRNTPAHYMLLTLSLFNSSAKREVWGAMSGYDTDEFTRDEAIAVLGKLSLVSVNANKFSMLPLTKIYAREELSLYPKLEILSIAYFSNGLRRQDSNPWASWTYLTDYRDRHLDVTLNDVIEVTEYCLTRNDETGLWRYAAQILDDYRAFFYLRGYWQKRVDLTEQVIDIADRLGELEIASRTRGHLAWILVFRDEGDSAIEMSLQALKEARKLGDLRGEYRALHNLIQAEMRRNDNKQAELYCLQALEIAEKYNQTDIFAVKYRIAETVFGQGDLERAKSIFSEVLSHFETTAHERGILYTLNYLCNIALEDNQLEEVENLLKRISTIIKLLDIQDKLAKLNMVSSQAKFCKLKGDTTNLLMAIDEALILCNALGQNVEAEKLKKLIEP